MFQKNIKNIQKSFLLLLRRHYFNDIQIHLMSCRKWGYGNKVGTMSAK